MLTAMFGKGAPDFTKSLKKNGLKGVRVGVLGGKFVNATYQGEPYKSAEREARD